jgi:hypothetical protein
MSSSLLAGRVRTVDSLSGLGQLSATSVTIPEKKWGSQRKTASGKLGCCGWLEVGGGSASLPTPIFPGILRGDLHKSPGNLALGNTANPPPGSVALGVLILVGLLFFWFLRSDPTTSFRRMADDKFAQLTKLKTFTLFYISENGAPEYHKRRGHVINCSYDVVKTDSTISPFIATITLTLVDDEPVSRSGYETVEGIRLGGVETRREVPRHNAQPISLPWGKHWIARLLRK